MPIKITRLVKTHKFESISSSQDVLHQDIGQPKLFYTVGVKQKSVTAIIFLKNNVEISGKSEDAHSL